jgi:hypothetical protein
MNNRRKRMNKHNHKKDAESDHVITVVFFGGILESVMDCPDDVEITLRDYDLMPNEERALQEDERGRKFCEMVWESPDSQRTITLIIDGLLVQEVIGIPPGVRVVIKDYKSTDGLAEWDILEDEHGSYYQSVWEHDTKLPVGPRIPHPVVAIGEHLAALWMPPRCPSCGAGLGGEHADNCQAERCKICRAFGIPKGKTATLEAERPITTSA